MRTRLAIALTGLMLISLQAAAALVMGYDLPDCTGQPLPFPSIEAAIDGGSKSYSINGVCYNVEDPESTTDEFFSKYPNYREFRSGDVWTEIGGSLGSYYGGIGAETCAARVSHALNRAGYIIESSPGTNLNYGGPNDGLRYIISANSLKNCLLNRWGTPTYSNISASDFSSLRNNIPAGRIAIVVSDGHATVLKQGYVDQYADVAVGGHAWVMPRNFGQ